jgi:hypothetical protein
MAIKFQRPRLFAFDSTTGEFLAEVRPEIDQAALNHDEINFLNPAFTTETAPPPNAPNLQPVWDGQQWNQVPDHRGDVWYTSVGIPVKVVDLGDPTALGLQQDKPVTEPEPEDPVQEQKRDLMVRLQEVTNIGASYVALKQEVPADILAEQSDLVNRIRALIPPLQHGAVR